MNKIKLLIGFIICVTIYMLIMLFIFKDKIFDSDSGLIMVLDNQKNYLYKDGKYQEISTSEIEKEDEFNVYIDGSNTGKYGLKLGNVWNLFDKTNNYKSYKGYLFAINDNSKIEVEKNEFRKLDNNEKSYIKKMYNISKFDNLSNEKVYMIDLNNDEKLDKLICLNYYVVGENKKDYYNLIIAIIDDKNYNIINEKGLKVNSIYDVKMIYKLDKDKYKSIIIEKITNPEGDIHDYNIDDNIYNFDGKKYKVIEER